MSLRESQCLSMEDKSQCFKEERVGKIVGQRAVFGVH